MINFPVYDVSLNCINEAALQYHLPAKLILSILKVEGGKTGKVSFNKNGTYDIGLMQINSHWLPELKKYGISEEQLKYDSCVNIKAGAWILSKKIAHGKSLSVGIGDYNSHTYHHNRVYFNKVQKSYAEISTFLS